MLRGSQDFASGADYQEFVKGMLARLNAGRKVRLAEEIAVMRELPERRLDHLLVQDLLAAKRDLRWARKSRSWRSMTASLSTRWDMSSKVERKWRSCSHCWQSAMNAAACC